MLQEQTKYFVFCYIYNVYVMHRSCYHFHSMQNSSCLQWHLKDENYESDNENCMNALLKHMKIKL